MGGECKGLVGGWIVLLDGGSCVGGGGGGGGEGGCFVWRVEGGDIGFYVVDGGEVGDLASLGFGGISFVGFWC